VRLDYGLGFWRVDGGRAEFPFSGPPQAQARALKDLAVRLVPQDRSTPTLWYVGSRG